MDTLHLVREVLLVAFLALACVWLLIDIARKLRTAVPGESDGEVRASALSSPVVASTAPAPKPAPLEPAEASSEALVVSEDISPKHLAVIAASIHHLFSGRARLVSVEADPARASWAREGRRDIFTSHRVR